MRNEYLIDRYQVVFDSGIGWHCVCAEFAQAGDCKHTRESAGRRAAQELIRNRVPAKHGDIIVFSHQSKNAI
jgi:hypothetical protein